MWKTRCCRSRSQSSGGEERGWAVRIKWQILRRVGQSDTGEVTGCCGVNGDRLDGIVVQAEWLLNRLDQI